MADQIRYDLLTQQALRGVVRSVLTDTAKKATCQTTLDASRAAVASYYSSHSPNVYPSNFDVMTSGANPDLELRAGLQHATPLEISSGGDPEKWTITLNPANGQLTADGDDASNCV